MLAQPQYLKSVIVKILVKYGTNKSNAESVSQSLVLSDLYGVDTHGLFHLPLYIDWIKKGEIKPNGKPEIIIKKKNTALVKGNWTFGQITAKFAMREAINCAEEYDMSIVGGTQVTHTGRLGEYIEMALSKKMIAFIFSGGFSEIAPITIPYGGKGPVLSTNPFAFGFPVDNSSNIICDFATTNIAGSKIIKAYNENKELPDGCLVNNEGNYVKNPTEFIKGSAWLVPFGEHKGYSIMLANEFIGGIVSSAKLFSEAPFGGKTLGKSGFTIIVFKTSLFTLYEDYYRRMKELINKIRKSKPAPGFKKVMLPGDKEREIYNDRIKNGIPVSDELWSKINDLIASIKF